MDYSPVGNELFTSFNKIGAEIDDIFCSLDIFSRNDTEKKLKGGSSLEFFDGQEFPVKGSVQESTWYKPNITHTDSSEERDTSTLSLMKHVPADLPTPDHNFLLRAQSSLVELSKHGLSPPVKSQQHKICNNLINLSSGGPRNVNHEKETCRKHQKDIKELRERIMALSDRIQVTVEERNKIFFKLEAAVREISTQGVKKEGLTQKVNELNQKMLENDFEINQLRSQIDLLNTQLETTHGSHETLVEHLDRAYSQIEIFKDEREKIIKLIDRTKEETHNVVRKYELLQKIHDHCRTINGNNQAERQVLFNKVEQLNSTVTKSEQEKDALIQNLNKVYKLVEKLEHKATEKIRELSRETKQIQNTNTSLQEDVQGKNAMLGMNKFTIRDLEAKVAEYEREIADAKSLVKDHKSSNQDAIVMKNKKIKMLSLKVKQLQNRIQTQVSQIDILTETNENLEATVHEEKLKSRSTVDESNAKDAKIKDLEATFHSQYTEHRDKNERNIAEIQATITNLTQQTEALKEELGISKRENSEKTDHISELQASQSALTQQYDAGIGEYQDKLGAKERKISRLKETVNQLFTAKQECETELQELRYLAEGMQHQLNSTHQEQHQQSEDLASSIAEKTLQIEQYKEQLEKLSLHQDSKLYEMELAYNDLQGDYHSQLSATTTRIQELETENRQIAAALDKSRNRQVKLKQNFGDKLREQNEVIDSCVDRTTAERHCEELNSYYHALFSPLIRQLYALNNEVLKSKQPCSPFKSEIGGDTIRDCSEVLEALKSKLVDETKENSSIVTGLKAELDKVSADYENQLQSQQILFGEELNRIQEKVKEFMTSHQVQISYDNSTLSELERIKEAEERRCEVAVRYEAANTEASAIQQKLTIVRNSLLEYRADSQAVGALEYKLKAQEAQLSRSREKMKKRSKTWK